MSMRANRNREKASYHRHSQGDGLFRFALIDKHQHLHGNYREAVAQKLQATGLLHITNLRHEQPVDEAAIRKKLT